jgi:hypothetical protein
MKPISLYEFGSNEAVLRQIQPEHRISASEKVHCPSQS